MEQNKTLTLGSLFDGSGGFPLGGLISGIRPVWASEIEPFPIRVRITWGHRPVVLGTAEGRKGMTGSDADEL